MRSSVKLQIILFVLPILFLTKFLSAQPASVRWSLTANQKVSEINGPILGEDETLSDMIVHDYSSVPGGIESNCQRTTISGEYWPEETSQNNARYIQFALSVKPGITFNIDTISMYYTGMGGHNMKLNIAYSTDSNFTTSTQLNTPGVPIAISDNTPSLSLLVYQLNTEINYGQKFYLRIYPWYTLYLTTKYVCLQNFVISGTTTGQVIPVLPIVSTSEVKNISTTTAVCGGNISFNGDAEVTNRGVCWNTTGSPTINDYKTSDGNGLGNYVSILTGLEKDTKYYVRAYAVNCIGTAYGNEDSLITRSNISVPEVITKDSVKVIGTSAYFGGELVDWGGSEIIERGVCFNTTGNPDINSQKLIDTSESNEFTSIAFALKNNITYYECAFARNAIGTSYGEIKEIKIPSVFNGAYADGIHKDTKVLQEAIDSCANMGGGIVHLMNGIYYSAPLVLKSNVTLQVDSTATILASADRLDYYPAGFDTSGGRIPSSVTNFITSSYADNIIITGKGIIDGNGKPWWDAYNAGTLTKRPRLIQLNHGKHILIENITLKNSPQFHFVPSWCIDVIVRNITILSPSSSPNTDGIDPVTSHKVRISDCYIDTGDDNVAIKSGYNDPDYPDAGSSDIIISNCTFLHGHGVSIGSETNGGVDSMIVDNCTFNETDNGIRIKSNRTRGGNVRGITYKNLTMKKVRYPILFSEYYPDFPAQGDPAQTITNTTPYYHDITVENVTATNCTYGGIIIGLPETPLKNIYLKNVFISASTGLRIRNATINADSLTVKANSGLSYIFEVNGIITDIKTDRNEKFLSKFTLLQNYPNPFNPGTKIIYTIPEIGPVKLIVYNLLGQKVKTLVNEIQKKGEHNIYFYANDLSSGVYIYKLNAGEFVQSKKMILLK